MPEPIPQRGPAPAGSPNERRKRRRRGGRGRRKGGPGLKKPQIQLEPIDLPEVIQSAPLTAYCRDCRTEVVFVLEKKKAQCTVCKGANVAFGTKVSVRNYFRLAPDGAPRRKEQ